MTTLETNSCPLCGNEAPQGQRYCTDCDAAGTYAVSKSGGTSGSGRTVRRSSNVPLILLFFTLSTFGTVMAGFFAPDALSIPLLTQAASQQSAWGEVRVARVPSNIRARATTSSQVTGKLTVGDSVRVEPAPGGWFKVYDAAPVPRADAEPLGFVYGRLLESANVQVAGQAEDPDGS